MEKTIDLEVHIPSGAEDHPVAMLVQIASRFDARIYIEENGMRANAKSIMGMMALGLRNGNVVRVSAEGKDEDEALAAIRAYLQPEEGAAQDSMA